MIVFAALNTGGIVANRMYQNFDGVNGAQAAEGSYDFCVFRVKGGGISYAVLYI